MRHKVCSTVAGWITRLEDLELPLSKEPDLVAAIKINDARFRLSNLLGVWGHRFEKGKQFRVELYATRVNGLFVTFRRNSNYEKIHEKQIPYPFPFEYASRVIKEEMAVAEAML